MLNVVYLFHITLSLIGCQVNTNDAKALTNRTAVTAGVVLLVLMVFRALLPWVLLALVGWWIWREVRK